MTLIAQAIVTEDGKLRLEIPTDLPAGKIDVELTFPHNTKTKRRNFETIAGKLSYTGDPMLIQREMRNDWLQ